MASKIKELNIEQEKLEIIKWVATLKDDTSIERLKYLKSNQNKSDWWNEISDEEKNSIESGISDIENGKIKPHKVAKRFLKNWA